MSHQLALADSEFSSKLRLTRKEISRSRTGYLLPWQNMLTTIEPVSPNAGNVRCSCLQKIMPHIHGMPYRFNLSDGSMADILPGLPLLPNSPRLHAPHRQILHQK
jgi:IS5 family transposase